MKFEPVPDGENDRAWVTLLRAGSLIDADAIATRLRAFNIEVFLPDEFASRTFPLNTTTGPQVRVQVPPSQYDQAREILDAPPTAEVQLFET